MDMRTERSQKGSLRRKQIIAESIRILARQGVASLSFESIAQATGMARAHIKYYFDSKEDLLLECFQNIAIEAQAITQQHLQTKHTWRERVLAIAEGAFDWLDRHPDHAAVLFLYYHYCCVDPKLAQLQRKVRTEGFDRLRSILQTAFTKKSQAWIDELAFDIQMYLTGVVMEMSSTRNFHDKKAARRAVEHVSEMINASKEDG